MAGSSKNYFVSSLVHE